MRNFSRRSFLSIAGGTLGIAALASCAPQRADSPTAGGGIGGSLRMANFEGWIGENQVSSFAEQYPDFELNQDVLPDGAWTEFLRQNEGVYDFSLGDGPTIYQLTQSGLISPVDASTVPNMAGISQQYIDACQGGMPLEYGKFGIAYNKEAVPNPPTTWEEFFERAGEWSGRLVLPSHNGDAMLPALLALGLNVHTLDEGEFNQGRDLVVGIKPHVKTFTETGVPGLMNDGSVDMLMAYDYDFATASAENDQLGWINPSEGTVGYIDCWMAFEGTENLETVHAFMNHALEPDVYGDFINTTYAASLLPEADEFIIEEIRDNPALRYDEDVTIYFDDPETSAEQEQIKSAAYQYLMNA